MNAPLKGSCESVCNVLEACVAKSKNSIELCCFPGPPRPDATFSIDRPPLLAVMPPWIVTRNPSVHCLRVPSIPPIFTLTARPELSRVKATGKPLRVKNESALAG